MEAWLPGRCVVRGWWGSMDLDLCDESRLSLFGLRSTICCCSDGRGEVCFAVS